MDLKPLGGFRTPKLLQQPRVSVATVFLQPHLVCVLNAVDGDVQNVQRRTRHQDNRDLLILVRLYVGVIEPGGFDDRGSSVVFDKEDGGRSLGTENIERTNEVFG